MCENHKASFNTSNPIEEKLTLDLSSCEASEDYYVNVLAKSNRKCTDMELVVDRGVEFNTLEKLLSSFPYLEKVSIDQNYSPTYTTLEEFLSFLRCLALKEFTLKDLQSEFLLKVDPKELFNSLPGDCNYRIVCGAYEKDCVRETYIDIFGCKTLIFYRGRLD